MRRPHLAAAPKRNRTRLLKKGAGARSSRRPRPRVLPGRLATQPEAGPRRRPAFIETTLGGVKEIAESTAAASAGCEPGCGFGAVRVGALLGRLRLHLQTERFLAVHRCDAMWEAGCVAAAMALADVVAGMHEWQLDAPLTSQRAQETRAPEIPAPEVRWQDPTLENEGWGIRKTGTTALAACGAALERSAQ